MELMASGAYFSCRCRDGSRMKRLNLAHRVPIDCDSMPAEELIDRLRDEIESLHARLSALEAALGPDLARHLSGA